MDIFLRYKKQIIALAGLLVVIIAVAIGFQLQLLREREGKIAVTILSVPNDATITINNSRTIQPVEQWLAPGEYSIRAKKDGFEDFNKTLTVSSTASRVLSINLIPLSEDAKKWAQDNQDLYLESEKVVGEETQQRGAAFEQTNPIVAELPYEDPYYTIGYRSPDNKNVELTITAPSALYRYNALQQIREWGYDPADFKIIYNDYKDQLKYE